MKYPNFNEEKKLWKNGYKYVVGLDEAGRGPLAGPVVAGAVMIKNFKFEILNFKSILNDKILKQVKDSKQLSPKKREKIYNDLIKNPGIKWGIGIVSEKMIDKINILEATKLSMEKAVKNLQKKVVPKKLRSYLFWQNYFLILDGNFTLQQVQGEKIIPQKSIIKADQKVFSVAAASIIAKVTRDRLMHKLHKKYPQYGFDKHKGYPTKAHFASLQEFGPCQIHRKTFYPVRRLRG